MIEQITQTLQAHENATRIKKLIFCASKRQWENNVEILNQHSTQILLQDLLTTHSTIRQLSHTLYRVVETLNRKAVYYPLANVILSELAPVYAQKSNESFTTSTTTSLVTTPLSFDKILQEFALHEDRLRIKKLVYCASQDRWENDPKCLDQISLKELISKLLQRNPTKEELSSRLYQVVQSLNRQHDYFLIANFILQELVKLYSVPDGVTQVVSASQPETPSQSEDESRATVYTEEALATGERDRQEVEYNPFELRLEVMKYTNPLRAKIVIFSILKHKFTFGEQDWSLLKTYTLDSLLLKLHRHHSDLKELEDILVETAQSLRQPYENIQAAGAILQSLKPLYPSA